MVVTVIASNDPDALCESFACCCCCCYLVDCTVLIYSLSYLLLYIKLLPDTPNSDAYHIIGTSFPLIPHSHPPDSHNPLPHQPPHLPPPPRAHPSPSKKCTNSPTFSLVPPPPASQQPITTPSPHPTRSQTQYGKYQNCKPLMHDPELCISRGRGCLVHNTPITTLMYKKEKTDKKE